MTVDKRTIRGRREGWVSATNPTTAKVVVTNAPAKSTTGVWTPA